MKLVCVNRAENSNLSAGGDDFATVVNLPENCKK